MIRSATGDEFEPEFLALPRDVQDETLAMARLLQHSGPHPGRPHVERSEILNMSTALRDLVLYLNSNRDSLPNYGERYRSDQPIATGWVESTVNEVIAKRMVKKQQMRWNRFTVQPFLTLRVHVLNATVEQVFRTWHADFRSQIAT